MTATLTQPTADVASPARIRITGAEAREIAQHVRAYIRPGRSWSEVQVMRECAHGCKLYVRQDGDTAEYRLFHSATYGCALGYGESTREVPVSVEVTPVGPAPAEIGDYVHVKTGIDHVQGYVNACTADSITLVEWSEWHMGSNRPTNGKPGEQRVLPITVDTILIREDEDDDEVL